VNQRTITVRICTCLQSPLCYIRCAQVFRCCRSHYVCFYELRPPVRSRYFIFCIASMRLFCRLSTKHPHKVDKEFYQCTAAISYT